MLCGVHGPATHSRTSIAFVLFNRLSISRGRLSIWAKRRATLRITDGWLFAERKQQTQYNHVVGCQAWSAEIRRYRKVPQINILQPKEQSPARQPPSVSVCGSLCSRFFQASSPSRTHSKNQYCAENTSSSHSIPIPPRNYARKKGGAHELLRLT